MHRFLKRSTFYFLLCGTCIMMAIMLKTGGPLKTAATPSGIINLEFADSRLKVDSTLTAWKNASTPEVDVVAYAKLNTGFDFIFLLFYSLFLYACCRQLAQMLPQTNSVAKWLNKIAVAALIAGFLDILENTGMLLSLSGNTSGTIAFLTTIISLAKWLLVILVLISIIAGLFIKIGLNKNRQVVN